MRMISDSVAAAGATQVWVKPGENLPAGLVPGSKVIIIGKTGTPQKPPVLFIVKTEEGLEVPGVAPCHLSATAPPPPKAPRDRTAEAQQAFDIWVNTLRAAPADLTPGMASVVEFPTWDQLTPGQRQAWLAVVEYLKP